VELSKHHQSQLQQQLQSTFWRPPTAGAAYVPDKTPQ